MRMKHTHLTSALYDYMLDISVREHEILKALREDTSHMVLAHMQAPPEQVQFFQFLLKLMQAKNVLELGTFTGYTTLALALALPDEGKVITCDINSEWTQKAYKFWSAAKQDHKITLRLAPALETMENLLKEGYQNQLDFIFIDADKTNYTSYYELSLQLIKDTGVVAIDNVFWGGKVIDKKEAASQTKAICQLNEAIRADMRVDISLLPIVDGIFLIKPRVC
jgi:predicted O-methyltransferase YrrM